MHRARRHRTPSLKKQIWDAASTPHRWSGRGDSDVDFQRESSDSDASFSVFFFFFANMNEGCPRSLLCRIAKRQRVSTVWQRMMRDQGNVVYRLGLHPFSDARTGLKGEKERLAEEKKGIPGASRRREPAATFGLGLEILNPEAFGSLWSFPLR